MYQEAGEETTVVDAHAHCIPGGLVEAARGGGKWHGVDVSLTAQGRLRFERGDRVSTLPWENPEAGLDERTAVMDEQEVDLQLLSHSPLLYWYDLDPGPAVAMAQEINDTLAAMVRQRPERFQGLAYLPLQDPDAAAAELRRAVSVLGLVGAAVGTNVAGMNWDAPELFQVLNAAVELDALVFVHPAAVRFPSSESPYHLRNVIGNPVETTVAVASMIFGGVFDRLPDLRVLLAHGGGYTCMGIGRFDHAGRVRKECQDIAALPSEYAGHLYYDSLTHSHQALRFLLGQVGAQQVVLGTDYPADMEQAYPVRWLREASGLDPDERHAILGRNASRLLGSHAGALPGGA